MNVFRSRKKSFGEAEARRPSFENAPPLPKSSSRTLFGRKKATPEPKPEIDLSSVLPNDNEFRTSLIMPNLSQRFSMLREQDDPNSKLGKASDDSVLFPKRHSRLNLFEGSLDDIAEVSSLAGSFKPPFATEGAVSYASDGGYDSDGGASLNGSIMSRAKPGQGNKFFGGRQKVYKIPTNGAASKNNSRPGSAGRTRPAGKAVYEEDISTSLWQKLRQEERSKRSFDFDVNDSPLEGRRSPSLAGYNRNRETSSSTHSNERNSTAATSMTSMADHSSTSLPGSMIKGDRPLNKRLYGQNIDQQMQDQQSSAVQRLNSVRNGRAGFQTLAPTRTASGAQRPGAISAANSVSSLRSGSPNSPAVTSGNGFDFGLEHKPSLLNTRDLDSGYQGSPNYTPPISPAVDSPLVAHLNPNDLGKATASGAFNKPKARYDEQQFAQRQLQLREGRDTPVQSNSRSETPIEQAPNRLGQDSDTSANTGRQMNLSHLSDDRSVSKDRNTGKRITGQALNGSYLAEHSDSEDDSRFTPQQSRSTDSLGRRANQLDRRNVSHPVAPPPGEIHPALRNPIQEEDEYEQANGTSMQSYGSSTLGQTSGGLNDMVRGHLRNVSDASSFYPESEPIERDTADSPSSTDEAEDHEPASSQAALADRAKLMLEAAKRARSSSVTKSGASPPQSVSPPALQLRQQSSIDNIVRKSHHARGPSTETQQERDAFADELADRRRQVEEKLRGIAESRKKIDSAATHGREPSPGTGLTKKGSKSSLVENQGPLGKLKKFMPGSASGSGATTPIAEPDSPPQFPLSQPRNPSDPNNQERTSSSRPGDQPPLRDRDIAAERRARHAEGMRSPRGTGAPPPRGRVDARRQQFAGVAGNLPADFSERVNANPDQGKPHFHPAGRARHYSPPRVNQTPDQKPMLPPQGPQSRSRGPINKGQVGRPGAPLDQNQLPRQPSNDRSNMITPPGNRGESPGYPHSRQMYSPNGGGAQMITPGTYPAPIGSPTGPGMPGAEMRHQAARKRSISKADISNPTFLSGTYDTRNVVDLPLHASLENGMAEVRAAQAAMNPPPVPPINPRRRATGAIKTLTRSNTGSPDHDDGSRGASPIALRRQMSEGTTLRGGNSPVKGY